MCHQAQKGFCNIFVGIPQHQKGYLVSCYVVFGESFSSALAYTLKPYAEDMVMRTAVSYTPYATSSKEQTGNIITFAQFEEGGILSKTRNYMEIGKQYDDSSTIPPLISE